MSDHSPSGINVTELTWSLMQAANALGFKVIEMGQTDPVPLLAFKRDVRNPIASVYLSGGIHGDEPASTLAILKLLQDGLLPDDMSFAICPLLNPEGMIRGTRENRMGIDLNRDYLELLSLETKCHVNWLEYEQGQWDLALFLHEDWESTGFYLYELNPEEKPSMSENVLTKVRPYLPIDEAEEIDGWEAKMGLIKPMISHEDRQDWPETFYLWAKGHCQWNYTFETPSSYPMPDRVNAHVAAITSVLEDLRQRLAAEG